ncbi:MULTISPECIES: acetyl-CoA carboxylase biotin carboxyl carrier protein [Streptococcus]|uniref:Biotin carboxyl carrier protein of acetyl-CoA carboxylase n=1 Tax=Streptococcus equinus ATCC 9812 TaxID=525379 RepID=E8JRN3_STREI|nr:MULTISPECIES: acetyl-CoA carboxylase biotin carboxyl carrier protein [Streptococcus]EFW88153.1 acetyl-CoA carboxylase, biotin carboxyl carrier protein [Streptococcus equinus ATCC 9812]MCQ2963339.1 acetyl-CoA carboxylase biotin carboxyl carrier protein [Streptococcus sp.]MCR5493319.1 acetyl-CoA carboxylase biotin carboxyl carrier protein [Streptococcus sp.]TFH44104.1 acetyl-CoA carboxylase biotin carboxyl carrier protein [Streptococcus equinus]UOC11509.1 acetyl-CoA carboxylase biotin carboxy
MNISEVKDLMAQFDQSSLREFSFKTADSELTFSKNEYTAPVVPAAAPAAPAPAVSVETTPVATSTPATSDVEEADTNIFAEGEEVPSPLVGVAYLAPAPDKPAFVSVGDAVKKGQTLLIIEAMKVMNEIPAPKDGIVTEIMVNNEEVVEFGQGLVRIK